MQPNRDTRRSPAGSPDRPHVEERFIGVSKVAKAGGSGCVVAFIHRLASAVFFFLEAGLRLDSLACIARSARDAAAELPVELAPEALLEILDGVRSRMRVVAPHGVGTRGSGSMRSNLKGGSSETSACVERGLVA